MRVERVDMKDLKLIDDSKFLEIQIYYKTRRIT